jgi:CDP-alcohol phosphatidyltransferase
MYEWNSLLAPFQFAIAFWLQVASILCDGLDGVEARLTKTNTAKGAFTDLSSGIPEFLETEKSLVNTSFCRHLVYLSESDSPYSQGIQDDDDVDNFL